MRERLMCTAWKIMCENAMLEPGNARDSHFDAKYELHGGRSSPDLAVEPLISQPIGEIQANAASTINDDARGEYRATRLEYASMILAAIGHAVQKILELFIVGQSGRFEGVVHSYLREAVREFGRQPPALPGVGDGAFVALYK